MGHYDWRDDLFSAREAEMEINSIKGHMKRIEEKRAAIHMDMPVIKQLVTRNVLETELNSLLSQYKSYAVELEGWESVKERIEKGQTFSWAVAHSLAKNE